jgi:cytochrome c oxidase assembly protein subunit 15
LATHRKFGFMQGNPTIRPTTPVPSPALRRVAFLALTLTILTFFLMVLGATVRAMDAGLSCPDWPLCQGQLLPPFDPVLSQGGNVPTPAQMNAEWFHRLLAGLVSFGMLGLAFAAFRSGNQRIKRWTWAGGLLLIAQIAMGAATVLLGNVHYSVAIHLGLATTFLVVLSWIARLAWGKPVLPSLLPGGQLPDGVRKQGRFFLGWLGLLLIVGALVASTPGADLVCPTFPACGRGDYVGVGGLVTLQMLHRMLAIGFFAWVLAITMAARHVPPLRNGAYLLAALTTLQVTFGIANVYLQVPIPLSAAHLGTAVLVFFVLFHWSSPGPAGEGVSV